MKKLLLLSLFLISTFSFSQSISFTFENARNTNDGTDDFYEADIYIASDVDFKLGSGQIYFTYNTDAFGSNIHTSGNFEYLQPSGSILAETYGFPAYKDFIVNDNTTSRVSTAFQQGVSSGTITANNVTSTAKHLFSIKIKYVDITKDPTVAFETDSVFLDQFYTACGPTSFGFPDCTNEPGTRIFDDNFDSTGATISSTFNWSGATDTDWNTTSNWNLGSVPSTTDDVVIPSGLTNYPTISSAVTVNSITINSGASLIANASITGTVTYVRNLPTTNWYLVSSPVTGETIEDIITNHSLATGSGGNVGLAPYTNNGASAWTYQTSTSTGSLNSAQGYSIKLAAAADVSFSGTINTSDVSFAIATGTRNNFNLVGNPFTAYINSATLASDSSNSALLSEETVWLWDGSQYVTYNIISPINIAPGQAFFVEASGNGNLTFSTSNQSHQSSDTFMKQAPIPSFELFVENNGSKKSTKVYYVDGKTTGYDKGYDGSIFGGVSQNFAVYTQLVANDLDKKLAIQTLPNSNLETMVIPLGLVAEAGKKITFSLETRNFQNGTEVYLEDKINNTFTNLSETNHTITTQTTVNGVGQYYIHIIAQKPIEEDLTDNNIDINIYKSSAREVTITGIQDDATIKVYSLLAKEVAQRKINSNGESTINLSELSSGIYVVKVISEFGNTTQKIILE